MVKGTVNLPLLAARLASDGQWSWAQGLPGPCHLGSTADGPSAGPASAAAAATPISRYLLSWFSPFLGGHSIWGVVWKKSAMTVCMVVVANAEGWRVA